MDVQTLALADECTAVSSHINDFLLRDLPDCLVDSLDLVRDVRDVLHGSVVRDDQVTHLLVPKTKFDQVLQQPRAYNLEFTRKYTTGVDVARVRLEAFVVTKNLAGRGGWHRGK